MELVQAEEMDNNVENFGEDITTNIDEFVVGEEIRETLDGALDLAVTLLESSGYSGFKAWHPRYGREVAHFVKDEVVIVADYRGTSLLTLEVLPDEEAKEIIGDKKNG